MSKIFDLDSPIMRGLSTLADLMILNLVTMVFCIPVITIGPALTAAHYVALKMIRNEEGYIIRGFWKSFKQNFRQGIILGLIVLGVVALLLGDLYIVFKTDIELNFIVVAMILVATVFVFLGVMYVFPVLAKFDNTVLATIKNSFLFCILNLPKSILMVFVYLFPVLIMLTTWKLLPIVILLGISVPVYLSAMLYNKVFRKFEAMAENDPEETEAQEEAEEPAEAEAQTETEVPAEAQAEVPAETVRNENAEKFKEDAEK